MLAIHRKGFKFLANWSIDFGEKNCYSFGVPIQVQSRTDRPRNPFIDYRGSVMRNLLRAQRIRIDIIRIKK